MGKVVIDVIKVKTATIASGASLSGYVEIDEAKHIGIVMPAEWTAADLTFQVSHNGSTWYDLYNDSGTEVTIVADSGRSISLDVAALSLAPWQHLKIRSGTSSVPVTQTAARTLYVVCKW
jgi:hypothetical protein